VRVALGLDDVRESWHNGREFALTCENAGPACGEIAAANRE